MNRAWSLINSMKKHTKSKLFFNDQYLYEMTWVQISDFSKIPDFRLRQSVQCWIAKMYSETPHRAFQWFFPVTKRIFPVGLKVYIHPTTSKESFSSGPRWFSSPQSIFPVQHSKESRSDQAHLGGLLLKILEICRLGSLVSVLYGLENHLGPLENACLEVVARI